MALYWLDDYFSKYSSGSRAQIMSRASRGKKSRWALYTNKFRSSSKVQAESLMHEQLGLDALTGYPLDINQRKFRHHIYYDKSGDTLDVLILMSSGSSSRIRDPRTQKFFGEKIQHTRLSREDMLMMEQAKRAFERGEPPQHWINPPAHLRGLINPYAVELFYLRKQLYQKYGSQVFQLDIMSSYDYS